MKGSDLSWWMCKFRYGVFFLQEDELLLRDKEPTKGGSSMTQASFNFINSIIGSGLIGELVIPYLCHIGKQIHGTHVNYET